MAEGEWRREEGGVGWGMERRGTGRVGDGDRGQRKEWGMKEREEEKRRMGGRREKGGGMVGERGGGGSRGIGRTERVGG